VQVCIFTPIDGDDVYYRYEIALGPLNKSGNSGNKDILFVGTNTNILAYDIDRNADVFFRDVQDGVNSLLYGRFGTYQPMLMVGGNCSLVGFDAEGNESFWTVTGDNVSSMVMADVNNDGITELVVGSDDFEIRVFRDEEVLEEITEVDKVTFLRKISKSSYAYGLANGTVGVYSGSKGRLWRVKTKHVVTSLSSYDINADGIEELLIGWNNGAFHVRNPENGDLMFKDKFSSPVAGIVISDYRKDGREEIIVVCESGDVKAYIPADAETIVNESSSLVAAESEDQKAILDLYQKKRDLTNDLKNLEKAMKMSRSTDPASGGLVNNTSLTYQLYPDFSLECLVLKVDVSPTDVIIVNVIVIDLEGGILGGCEVLAITPSVSGKPASINLHPNKYNACTIRVQTHVASRGASNQLHVFEKDILIPKFCSFLKLPDHTGGVGNSSLSLILGDVVPTEPLSKVVFKTTESTSRIADYINSSFLLPQPFKVCSL
jgi:Bardet-Biedl syndrome 2 protein